LKVRQDNRLPAELGGGSAEYDYVRIEDLRKLLEGPAIEGVTRYFPGTNAATRRLLSEAVDKWDASGGKLQWSEEGVGEVPDFIEALPRSGAFFELASEIQSSRLQESAAACDRLRSGHIRAALICAGDEPCGQVVTSAYAIVVKVAIADDPDTFKIPNAAECSVIRSFAGDQMPNGCGLQVTGGRPTNHVTLLSKPKRGLPDYLSCATR
jgi:hypothetical protein